MRPYFNFRTSGHVRGIFVFIVSVFVLLSSYQAAATRLLHAEGQGETRQAARDDALNSLASNIFVEIESNSDVYQSDTGDNYFKSTTHTSTELPIMGANLECYDMMGKPACSATLDLDKAKGLYLQNLKGLQRDINLQLKALSKLPVQSHYEHLAQLLAAYQLYEKYLTVLTFITGQTTDKFAPKTTKFELRNKLLALEKRVNSLSLAADLLSRGVKRKDIYVSPAKLADSHSVTPFAKALLDHLKTRLQTVAEPKHAKFLMNGSYQINKNGILVTYSLVDKKGKNLQTYAIELSPTSYQQYEITPRDIDFEKLLHSGYVIPSSFKVELTTNEGNRNLALDGGDELRILAKMNQPGYLYVVGYVDNPQMKFSYLLDIGPETDNPYNFDPNHFIRYIGPSEVNKWVELAPPFEVCPPYGTESLQVIASDKKLDKSIPQAKWNEDLGYYIVDKNIKAAVVKTRGFKPKRAKDKKSKGPEGAEAVMMISTFKGKRRGVCEG